MRYTSRDAKQYTRDNMRGVWAAIPYPFTQDGELDEAALRRDLRYYVDGLKLDGLFIGGLLGEFWSLTMAERRRGHEVVVEEVAGKAQIIAHTVCSSIRETVALTQHAQEIGADYVIMGNPAMSSRDPEVIFNFFREVCADVDIGVGLFNTAISGYVLSPELIGRLAEIENIVCVKDAQPMAHVLDTRPHIADKILMCDPLEADFLENMLVFGDQVHMASPAPYLFQTPGRLTIREYYDAVQAGREDEARRISSQLGRARFLEQKWINAPWSKGILPKAAIKAWSELLGLSGGSPRAPLRPLTSAQKAELKADLVAAGLLEGRTAAAAE